jgi:hypothetical protein
MRVLIIPFVLVILSYGRCDEEATLQEKETDLMHFVGSTPGDSMIKTVLGIPAESPVDFMRWNLVLQDSENKNFELRIHYGLSQPNTRGFAAGDVKRFYGGKYTMEQVRSGDFNGEVYRLKSDSLNAAGLSLVKLGDHLLHLLEPGNRLMVGNGGWSYTLNRTPTHPEKKASIHTLIPAEAMLKDTTVKIVFEGRTPCTEFAGAYNLTVDQDCFKLKWRLTLNRDPVTRQPSTYKLERTDIRRTGSFTGKWTIVKTPAENAEQVIYQLDPDQPDKTLSMLAGDENVLFFLDGNHRLFTGNEDHSYTLNRKL